MENVVAVFSGVVTFVVILILIVGFIFYARMLYRAYIGHDEVARKNIDSSPAHNLGLPVSALVAFAIVTVLKATYGTLTFKVLDLEFSGPASPVTLWLVCYLGLVWSMRLARAP